MADSNGQNGPNRGGEWVRWLVGGLVAGLIAYAGVGGRLASLETEVRLTNESNREERARTRDTVDRLTEQVSQLTEQVRQLREERQQRVEIPVKPKPTFRAY